MYAFVLLILVAGAQCVDWESIRERRIYTYLKLESGYSWPQEAADARVVGGEEATPHQFPYQVGLLMNFSSGQQSFCGGSLISSKYVLTAAHCVDGVESVEAILGAHNIKATEEVTQVRLTSKNFTVHEDWNPNLLRNDIALVVLPEAVKLNKYIQTIRLPAKSSKSTYSDDTAIISGWGKDFDVSNHVSPVLRWVEVEVENNFRCSLSYPFFIRTSHICTSGKGGKSSCNGDSGGPLTVTEGSEKIQVGIVSFGRASGCEKGHPAVFTRTSSYLDWIQQNTDLRVEL